MKPKIVLPKLIKKEIQRLKLVNHHIKRNWVDLKEFGTNIRKKYDIKRLGSI